MKIILITCVIFLCSCTQPEVVVETIELSEFKVESRFFDSFMKDYQLFIESLGVSEKDKLIEFLSQFDNLEKQSKQGKVNDVTCNCQQGESSCSASTAISSCCICWNPSTHQGACGTYWGIASCKTEAKEPERLARVEVLNDNIVNVNAKNFRLVLDFIKKMGIKEQMMRQSLKELESHAI